MKSKKIYIPFLLITLIILAAGAWLVYQKRGVPFVTTREQWTIGIFRGDSPLSVTGTSMFWEPVLRAEDITDFSAKFVADPFLLREEDRWYLFFEVYNNQTGQGDLAVATSQNARSWDYDQVVLDETFHLSYPYVFEWEDSYYMIPESFEANAVRLYKADEFPNRWSFVTSLVEGDEFVDNSIVRYDEKWWLFSSVTSNDTLRLFYADELEGPWMEHPQSPIVEGDKTKARPSGRMIVYEDRLYRFTMDIAPAVGTHAVMAYEITTLTPTEYSERLAKEEPIVQASGSGWNRDAMHQLDPVQIGPQEWIASVDGFGEYILFGWQY